MSSCATWRPTNRRSGRASIAIFAKSIEDKKFQNEVEQDESLNYLLRDTISLTMLGGSEQTNVIAPEAWANLDVRILPGGDPKALLEAIRRVVNDPNVTVEPLNAGIPPSQLLAHQHCALRRHPQSVGALFPGNAGGAAHHQRLHREPALPSAGHRRLRIQSLHGDRAKRETPNTATTNASAWRKCGAGRGFCLMWWPPSRAEYSQFAPRRSSSCL